ncbi:MAG: hypothetical protein HYY01_00735 [Chloroflexi bacterium]|nr:hypothetical protein [Chloroflexota bacterium]
MAKTGQVYKRTTITLPLHDYEVLRFVAFKRGTSVAGVIRGMVQELLEDEEDIRDGLNALQEKEETLDWDTFKREYLGL